MSLETIKPYKDASGQKKEQIEKMFDHIAGRYDFLNHFLSFGVDLYWRKKAIQSLQSIHPKVILDIATGTADLAIEALKLNPEKIFGVDLSEEMLENGRKKLQKKGLIDKIELLKGDSEKLIFDDNKFDAVTVSFGVRNFQNLEKGLEEMRRVLKPGGMLMILEFSQPKNKLILPLYSFYSSKVTPQIGKFIAGDKEAYSYLHDSVSLFPSGNEFAKILTKTGYRDIKFKPLTFGIATVYTAIK